MGLTGWKPVSLSIYSDSTMIQKNYFDTIRSSSLRVAMSG